MRKERLINILLWLALAAMWSSSYSVIKIGVATLDPPVLVFGRMVVGTLVIYGVMRWRGMTLSRDPAVWFSHAVTGLLGSAVPFLLITFGEQSIESALASILMGATPVITLLLTAWLIPEETLSLRTVLGVIGGLFGVAVLVGPTALAGLGAQLGGQSAILAATICYAVTTSYVRRFVTRAPLEMATGSMIVGTLFMGCVVAATGTDVRQIEATGPSLGAALYLGLFSTACANLIYFYLVPRLGATRMSQINFAVPAGGALIGALLLSEALTLQRLIALGIIVISIYLGTSKPGSLSGREIHRPAGHHPRR